MRRLPPYKQGDYLVRKGFYDIEYVFVRYLAPKERKKGENCVVDCYFPDGTLRMLRFHHSHFLLPYKRHVLIEVERKSKQPKINRTPEMEHLLRVIQGPQW